MHLTVLLVFCGWTWSFGAATDLRAEPNPCQGRPNGSYQRHPLGCKYFIMCVNNNVNSGACPAGLAFNPARPPCDLAVNVGCLDEISTSTRPPTTTTTTTTVRPTTTTSTTPRPTTTVPPTTSSTTTSTTTTTPVPTTTTTPVPTTTTTPVPTTTTTPVPTTTTPPPDTTTTSTTIPPPALTTTPTPATLPPSTSTTATSTTVHRPTMPALPTYTPPTSPEPLITCPLDEDPTAVRFLSSNTHCSKYYICYHNQPMEMTCSDGLHWNHRTQKCDLPDRAGCIISATPSFFPVCARETIGLYAHPFRCELFLYCYHGHMTVQQCPFYYHWDVDRQTCELKDVARCGANMIGREDEWGEDALAVYT